MEADRLRLVPVHLSAALDARFGMVTSGIEAPSDHYGIIAEYATPGSEAPIDRTAPIVNLLSPVSGGVFNTGAVVEILVDATDDLGVARVELLQNGVLTQHADGRAVPGDLQPAGGSRGHADPRRSRVRRGR
jgi:hypothetical protein